ncbi:MAG: helix-turn-helix domain-containing protein [Lutibacter sp.]|uniref:helix-turn-helix domain-containing protein n=1 Tax=Lutibacter sp. TaxID=1925666 RepID=UPI0019EB29F7|nr:helix-turn-helix transcriptional regulator [Lutibacter sp.]NOR27537.1 helix-turn-helix domain-containing protein [Lutibacter sp.]
MNSKELDQIRNEMGWTKREMAKRLGISEVTLNRYINKDNNIPKCIEYLAKTFKIFHVNGDQYGRL